MPRHHMKQRTYHPTRQTAAPYGRTHGRWARAYRRSETEFSEPRQVAARYLATFDCSNRRSASNQTSLWENPGKLAFKPLGLGTTNTRAPASVSRFAPAPPLRGSRKNI